MLKNRSHIGNIGSQIYPNIFTARGSAMYANTQKHLKHYMKAVSAAAALLLKLI